MDQLEGKSKPEDKVESQKPEHTDKKKPEIGEREEKTGTGLAGADKEQLDEKMRNLQNRQIQKILKKSQILLTQRRGKNNEKEDKSEQLDSERQGAARRTKKKKMRIHQNLMKRLLKRRRKRKER